MRQELSKVEAESVAVNGVRIQARGLRLGRLAPAIGNRSEGGLGGPRSRGRTRRSALRRPPRRIAEQMKRSPEGAAQGRHQLLRHHRSPRRSDNLVRRNTLGALDEMEGTISNIQHG